MQLLRTVFYRLRSGRLLACHGNWNLQEYIFKRWHCQQGSAKDACGAGQGINTIGLHGFIAPAVIVQSMRVLTKAFCC